MRRSCARMGDAWDPSATFAWSSGTLAGDQGRGSPFAHAIFPLCFPLLLPFRAPPPPPAHCCLPRGAAPVSQLLSPICDHDLSHVSPRVPLSTMPPPHCAWLSREFLFLPRKSTPPAATPGPSQLWARRVGVRLFRFRAACGCASSTRSSATLRSLGEQKRVAPPFPFSRALLAASKRLLSPSHGAVCLRSARWRAHIARPMQRSLEALLN